MKRDQVARRIHPENGAAATSATTAATAGGCAVKVAVDALDETGGAVTSGQVPAKLWSVVTFPAGSILKTVPNLRAPPSLVVP